MRLVALALLVSTAAAGSGRVVRVERTPSREVFVPAGTFEMGVSEEEATAAVESCNQDYEPLDGVRALPIRTPSGREDSLCVRYAQELDKMHPRDVTLPAFAIDRDEVTVAAYRQCVGAGACPLDALIDGDERYLRDDWPMVNVTWFEARQFCRWRGGRLPTEAEWERAARGDDARPWPWGKVDRPADFNHGRPRADIARKLDRAAAFRIDLDVIGDSDDGDGRPILAPPGSYPWGEGPYGTRDQAGNVAEWTADVRGLSDATLGYQDLPAIAPRREPTEHQTVESVPRVVRGGSWRQPAWVAHANLRDPFSLDLQRLLYLPQQRFSHVGFRCARDLR